MLHHGIDRIFRSKVLALKILTLFYISYIHCVNIGEQRKAEYPGKNSGSTGEINYGLGLGLGLG